MSRSVNIPRFLLSLLFCSLCLFSCTQKKQPSHADETQPRTEAVAAPTETEPAPPRIAEETTLQSQSEETETASAAIEETTAAITTEPVQAEESAALPQTIDVPRLVEMPYPEAEKLLSAQNITPSLSYEYSENYAKDIVIKANFHGSIEDGTYHISPDHPVELKISLGRKPLPTTQRVNVQASEAEEKIIYLTFDDGPSVYTEDFLKVLEEHGVRATFFMVGQYVGYHPERAKAVYDAGHVLACHSNTHDYESLYVSADTVMAEIDAWAKNVEKATGEAPAAKIFRFPGGSNTRYLEKDRMEEIYAALHENGYFCFDWTFADNDRYLVGKPEEQSVEDYLKDSVKATLKNVASNPKLPKIMLMHDTSPETLAILPWMIEYLTEDGYTFGTLDTLEGDWLFQ